MKKLIVFLVLVLISRVPFADTVTLDENIKNDIRYSVVLNLVKQSSLNFDEENISYQQTSSGLATLIPIVDESGDTVGVLSVHDEKWRVSFSVNNVTEAFNVKIDEKGSVKLEKPEKVESNFKKTVFNPEDTGSLQEVSMTGSNWCMYTSKTGSNIGCFSPDSNPFSYYFVVTYREGSRITKYSQSYRADYKGRAVVCPVKDTKVLNLPQCGFPPD